MTYTIVIPFIYQPYLDKCLATMHPSVIENVFLVDNTKENKGVAASWNLGIDRMNETKSDWLIILSASMRFGVKQGLDLVGALERNTNDKTLVIDFDNFHCIALRNTLLENVGRFDENFYPIYWEDIDYSYRINLTYGDKKAGGLFYPEWVRNPIDISCESNSHGVAFGGAKVDTDKLINYITRKWGGQAGSMTYQHPFNNPANDVKYWRKAI